MVFNLFIHDRLCEVRLVLLVVAISPVSDDIDEDVFLEFLSILNCDLHAFVQNIGLITIYVNYWSIDCLSHLSAVVGRSALLGICCKPDLVVQNYVNNASGAIIN